MLLKQQAYFIGDYDVFYTINVTMEIPTSTGTTKRSYEAPGPLVKRYETLMISPFNRVALSSNKEVRVKLVGDFASFKQIPSLRCTGRAHH